MSIPRWVSATGLSILIAHACVSRVTAQFGEIGLNDIRLTEAGGTGNLDAAAILPRIAFAPSSNTFLVVWREDALQGPSRLKGQRYDGVTGDRVGVVANLFTFSSTAFQFDFAVAFNSAAGQFVVVVSADAIDAMQELEEFEVFAINVDAASSQTFYEERISEAGGLGDPEFDATDPAIACSSVNRDCLVVWRADDNTGGLINNEFEIFGQRIDALDGSQLGVDDFRISDMGGTGPSQEGFASYPKVAHNSVDDEYLVVWSGTDNVGGLVLGENEVFGQLLDADGGSTGFNDFRISTMGGTGDPDFDASSPDVQHNPVQNEYLVVWSGDDNVGGLVDDEFEVRGQLLTASGDEIGPPGFRISDMGDTGDDEFDAVTPALTFDPEREEYLVTWRGDDNVGFLVDDEIEIFGQRIEASSGAEVGSNDFRISDLGPVADVLYPAQDPAVAYNNLDSRILVVWWGEDDRFGLINNEREVFGQFLGEQTIFVDGLESGDTTSWTQSVP